MLTSKTSADERLEWYNRAVQDDLAGASDEAVQSAFAEYRRAADAGLPEAEFDVGVMLDSGRGVAADVGQAATWYARAASHGNQRAAYNLGQLYEAGEGVPRNPGLAGAWFAASDLPAARLRLERLSHTAPPAGSLSLPVPSPTSPGSGQQVSGDGQDVELVWTSAAPAQPVSYVVEIRSLTPEGSREVYSGSTRTSALLASLPARSGDYAWRVLAIAGGVGSYSASAWTRFMVAAGGGGAKSEARRSE